jgi:Fibronectin type III domain
MRLPLIVTTVLVTTVCSAPLVVATTAQAAPTPAYGATWTADTAGNSLTEYAPSASGAATPIATISGGSTGLDGPSAVAVGPEGSVYAANSTGDSITEYASGTNGDVAPIATISGSLTGLNGPSSLTLANGEVWVTDPATNTVEAFSAGTTGNELPAQSISGLKTRLDNPIAVTVDREFGLITVLNAPTSDQATLTIYERVGDVTPIARTDGPTGHPMVKPTAIISSGFGLVWVADAGRNSLTELFVLGGVFQPQSPVHGTATDLDAPTGISLDASDQLVVANGRDHTVRVFGEDAHGNVAPIRTIDGVGSVAGNPAAVSVFGARPGAPTEVTAVAHNASATLHWHAPAVTGGAVVGYDVSEVSRSEFGESSSGGGEFSFGGVPTTTHKTTYTQHHLRNGTRYFFLVQAVNVFGVSPSARSNSVKPLTVPSAVGNVIAAGGTNAIAVGWTKPAKTGGDPIKHYRVEYATCAPGAPGCGFTSKLIAAKHRHVRINGLQAATKYDVRVIAESAFGSGHPSKLASAKTS